jgi:hypothetical protein
VKEVSKEESFFKKQKKKRQRQYVQDRKEEDLYTEPLPRSGKTKHPIARRANTRKQKTDSPTGLETWREAW